MVLERTPRRSPRLDCASAVLYWGTFPSAPASPDVSRVQWYTMSSRTADFAGRHIVVADEDRAVVGLVVETLLNEGHAVFHASDGLSANQLAFGLKNCDLVISNTRVGGKGGIDLIRQLRQELPDLPILYLANKGKSTPELERHLPKNLPSSGSRLAPSSFARQCATC